MRPPPNAHLAQSVRARPPRLQRPTESLVPANLGGSLGPPGSRRPPRPFAADGPCPCSLLRPATSATQSPVPQERRAGCPDAGLPKFWRCVAPGADPRLAPLREDLGQLRIWSEALWGPALLFGIRLERNGLLCFRALMAPSLAPHSSPWHHSARPGGVHKSHPLGYPLHHQISAPWPTQHSTHSYLGSPFGLTTLLCPTDPWQSSDAAEYAVQCQNETTVAGRT